ncbi:MAG: hypothetical protein JWM57_3161 [Phycisphaerales bacterium]|nr:hypothetical protein [Phycisphaerales bacterium]
MSFAKIVSAGLRVCGFAACLMAVGYARPAAAANLLLSPGFEAGIDGSPNAGTGDVATAGTTPWNSWNNWAPPNYTGFYTASFAHGGTQAGKTYSGPNCGIYQTVNITGGDTYTASAFFLNATSDPLGGGAAQTEDIRLTWQDALGNAIGASVISPTLSGASPKDVWTQISLTAAAPAGASKVQVLAFMNNPNNAGGSMFVDDASLTDVTATPEPASLGLLSVAGVALLRRRRGA